MHSHLLEKLIALFLILIIPMVLIASLSMINFTKKIKSESIISYLEKTRSIANSADIEFEHIFRNAISISNHSKLNKLTYTSDFISTYDRISSINQLREYITNIKFLNSIISNIKIYVKPLHNAYNTDGYEAGSVETITDNEFEETLTHVNNQKSTLVFHDGYLYYYIQSGDVIPLNIVEIRFSNWDLKKYFNQSFTDTPYYIEFENGYFITNIDNIDLFSLLLHRNIDASKTNFSITDKDTNYHVVSSEIKSIKATCYQLISDDLLMEPVKISFVYTILFFIICIICILLFFYGSIQLIHNPLTKLITAFESIRKGNFNSRITFEKKNEFTYLFESFNNMSSHLSQLIDEDYNKTLLLQKAEFKQLQAQINPHFLYNSFFMLQRLMQRELHDDAVQIAKALGTYFEYITKNYTESDSLANEYEHAKIYAEIQALRFSKRIRIELDPLPEQYKNITVPRLILQPILENAFFYGLENKISNGLLRIRILALKENQLEINIEDNGEALDEVRFCELSEKIQSIDTYPGDIEFTGLLNIAKRIRIFYRNHSSLNISKSSLGGMKVSILIESLTDIT